MVRRRFLDEPPVPDRLVARVRELSRPLRKPADLTPLVDRAGPAKVVLIGEASHGTHEFYAWRAALSKRLIQEHGFSFVGVEGDWPDCYRVNRFVKGFPGAAPDAASAVETFRRWPTWMWANEDVREFLQWLRRYNDSRPEEGKCGFYGLDVYSLWDSMREVMRYLRKQGPEVEQAGRRLLSCFEPYGGDEQEYAMATLFGGSCADEAVGLLSQLRAHAEAADGDGRDGHFVAEQNALVIKNAEAYYRAMVRGDSESWNVRDRHMAETLDRLLARHGPGAKGIVWAHNTHVGDAQFTDMAGEGMVNLGELAREHYGELEVVLVGFGSYEGTVIAGAEWGAPHEVMDVPAAREGSWEWVLHEAGPGDKLLVFPEGGAPELAERRGHRAIGVVYRPQYERYGNYVPTALSRRYDAFLWLAQSQALEPLLPAEVADEHEVPETYPTGV